MKKGILKIAFVLGAVIALGTGCKKEAQVLTTQNPNDIDVLTNQVDATSTMEASTDLTNGEIVMLNMGISEDALVVADDIDAPEGPAGGKDDTLRNDSVDDRKHIRAKSFIFCLRKLDLSQTQIEATKKALRQYEECKSAAVKRARVIYQDLKKEYKGKMERLTAAFKAKSITEAQYKEGIEKLRKGFSVELRNLHLQEKLELAFRNCMKELLGKLKLTLNDKQWSNFVACHRK